MGTVFFRRRLRSPSPNFQFSNFNSKIRLPSIAAYFFAAALFFAAPCAAQLDLGSHDIPKDSIDAYMAPFYRLVAAGLGADRYLPGGNAFGWHAGTQGGAVPIPEGRPFDDVAISLLPLFRMEGGLRAYGLGVMGRGLAWSDPRMGELTTYGGGLSLGREFGGVPLPGGRAGTAFAALVLGWDRLEFSSEYTYVYEGTVLGLFGQEIPGNYTLAENLTGLGLQGALGSGDWRLRAESMVEWASGSFRYLYTDPRTGEPGRLSSHVSEAGFRAALGLSWRGFRVQAAWRDFPVFSAGWSSLH